MKIDLIRKIIAILDVRQRVQLIGLIIMIVIGAAFETIGVSAILPFVTVLTDHTIVETNETYSFLYNFCGMNSIREFILFFAMILAVVYVVKNTYLLGLAYIQNAFIYSNQRKLSIKLFSRYVHEDYQKLVNSNVADIQRNIRDDVNIIFMLISNLIQLIAESLVIVFLISYLFVQDFVSTFILLILLTGFMLLIMKTLKKHLTQYGESVRRINAGLTKNVLETFGGIKEIKALSLESYFENNYDDLYKTYVKVQKKQSFLNSIPKPLIETLCIGGLLGYVVVRILNGAELSSFISLFSVFAVAAIRLLPSFSKINGNITSITYYKPSLNAIFDDIKNADLDCYIVKDSSNSVVSTCSDYDGVELNGIVFYYDTRPENAVIENANLAIPRNSSIAIVGPSGAGKTTLADIILGILPPKSGNVLFKGQDIYKDLNKWHEIIGYIPQTISMLDDSIRKNVAFGISDDEIDDDKVWKALQNAQLEEYIKTLPDQLDTRIGERGLKLSGGQRQRIGIARALYREPEILLLDEATSALDGETETAVMEAINNLLGKVTMIIIAHRLTTIRNCDTIYRVDKGQILKVEYDDLNNTQ